MAQNVVPARTAESASQRMNSNLFLWFCAAAALDFRSEERASSIIQACLGIMACIVFGLIMLNTRRPPRDLPLLRRLTWLWWIYLASSVMVAMLRNVAPLHYLRTIFPYLLMGEGLIIGYFLLAEREENATRICRALFYTSAVSSLVFLIKGLTTGRSVEELRYFILSPLLIVLFSFAIFRLIFEGYRSGWINYAAIALSVGIMFLSLTRTFILCLVAILAAIAYSVFRPPAWLSSRLRRKIIIQIFRTSVLVPILAVGLIVIFPSILQSWTDRTSVIGTRDVTGLARIAEAAWELETMTSDLSHFVFGSGIGSDHSNDTHYLIGLVDEKHEDYAAHVYFPGHIAWPYELYASGILMGLVLPFMFIVAIWRGCSRQSSYVSRMAAVAVLAILTGSTLGNILFYRGGGIGLGLLIALCAYGPGKERKARGWAKGFKRRLVDNPISPQLVQAREIPSLRKD